MGSKIDIEAESIGKIHIKQLMLYEVKYSEILSEFSLRNMMGEKQNPLFRLSVIFADSSLYLTRESAHPQDGYPLTIRR